MTKSNCRALRFIDVLVTAFKLKLY